MSNVNQALRFLATTTTILVMLGGCSNYEMRDTNIQSEMQDAFEVQSGNDKGSAVTPPAEVNAALLPPVHVQLPGIDVRADVEQRFDVKVRRVRARDFFLSLVENTPYSMVVHPKVKGYITLDLKNASVPEVLKVVRSVNGFDYKTIGHNVQVFPNTIHTRIFMVDYLAMKRAGQSLITSKTGQISTARSSGSSGDSESGSSGGSSGENSSVITTTTDADFWQELKSSLETIIGQEKGRKVAVNPQTGMVMVRAMPDEMRVVEEFLQNTQDVATRQVILEARIIEVVLSDGFQSGINWAGLRRKGSDTLTAGQTGGGTIFSGSGVSSIYSNTGTLDPAAYSAVEGTDTSAFGGVFSLALSTTDFTAFIELLKTQGDVQVLSSPRVSTVNNQKAVIKVGSDEFYVTSIDTETTSTTGSTNVSVELDPFFSGVALDVTPQISQKGDIVLHVHPSVSEVNEQTKTVDTTFGTLTMPLAASNIRESDTVIRAANGQVVVIGGLMQNATQDEVASVPLLGDIPILGALFRHTKKSKRKSELVILLKPTVIDANGEIWQQELKRSSGTIRDMSQNM